MFRDLRRKNKQLSTDECLAILSAEKRGVLSVLGDDGYPYGMPMNHFYNKDDGAIYFHSGKGGHRNDSIVKSNKACFCVYDSGLKKDGDWALNIKSVVVFGRIEIVDDINTVTDISRKLCYKFTNDEKYISEEIDRFASSTLILKLTPEHIRGKTVEEK